MTTYELTSVGALAKDRGLRDQMRRASVSIASNIAEGNERGTDRDACRFLYMARGSAGELLTQADIAVEIGLMNADLGQQIISECEQIARMLSGLIASRSRGSFP